MLSSQSFFSLVTDSSSQVYAKASLSSSYELYNNVSWSMWGMWQPSGEECFSKWESITGNNRSWLFSTQADQTFRIIASWDGTNFCLLKTTNPILDFSWHHYVITFSDGVFLLYIDNVLQTFQVIIPWSGGNSMFATSGVPVMIANLDPSAPDADSTAGGCYSNFSIWNKVLTTDDITALYNGGVPADLTAHPSHANLKNWWRMDQSDTPPTLTDSVGAAHAAITVVSGSGIQAYFQQTNNVPKITEIVTNVVNKIDNAQLIGSNLTATLSEA